MAKVCPTIKEINKITLIEKTCNVLLSGKIYEYFIGRDESAISELGAYFTDRHIVDYILQKLNSGEFRITGADVSIFWLNPKTKAYELWPANDFRQTNPQTTDVTGRYAFLVPPGMYYLKVTAPSYSDYQNAPFKVEESKGVFMNIEMRQEWSFVNLFSVQNILLGIISVVLIYIAIIFTIRRRKKL